MFQKLKFLMCCAIVPLALSSCITGQSVRRGSSLQHYEPIRYSVICIIHGDGSYLYHDSNGNSYIADEEVLRQILEVAKHSRQGEILIFHQKRMRRVIGLFPLKDGEFYYFRHGALLEQKDYSRKHSDSAFGTEIELVKDRAEKRYGKEEELTTFFLYFGHQIPEWGGKGYHGSYPAKRFTIQHFAEGLEGFRNIYSSVVEKFDLIILSTCYSGTPGVISTLLPHSRYIIASPDNLHLSHINIQLFNQLDETEIGDIYQFARVTVQKAFTTLKEKTMTMITVALYDTEKVKPYLESIHEEYLSPLETNRRTGEEPSVEFYDCFDNPNLRGEYADVGIDIFYQAPRFGRKKNRATHSGWECMRLKQNEESS
jgi:hypothetical protein